MEFDFQIISGKVNLSDPCYNVDTWCGAYNVPARNGDWHVEVEHIDSFGNRVKQWKAYHKDFRNQYGVLMDVDFGVDSGQFGIFDSGIYNDNSEYDEPGFYRDCCDITLTKDSCGVVSEQGFVSSSGFGDGSYIGLASYDDNGDLTMFEIDFISSYDDEEEE
jgi:hypothetical protein